jgi:hypothetical protein
MIIGVRYQRAVHAIRILAGSCGPPSRKRCGSGSIASNQMCPLQVCYTIFAHGTALISSLMAITGLHLLRAQFRLKSAVKPRTFQLVVPGYEKTIDLHDPVRFCFLRHRTMRYWAGAWWER